MKFKITIGTRLLLAFGVAIAAFCGTIALGITELSSFKTTVHSITAGDLPKVQTATSWMLLLQQASRHTSNMLILDDPEKIKAEITAVEDADKTTKKFMESLTESADTPAEQAALKAAMDARSVYETLEFGYLRLVEAGVIPSAKRVLLDEAMPAQLRYLDKLSQFVDLERAQIRTRSDAVDPAYERTRSILLLLSLAAAAFTGIVAFVSVRQLRRQLGGEPGDVAAIANKVALGDYSSHVVLRRGDTTSLFASVAKMQQSLVERIDADRRRTEADQVQAAENARIRIALDAVSVAVLLADVDGKIIYANGFATNMFRLRSGEIRKALPQFDADRVVGISFDAFHRSPAQAHQVLANLKTLHTLDIKMGDASLRVILNPVVDREGKRLGTVVQFIDRTEERAIEEEVQAMVSGAIDGNMTIRISEEGKDGFFKTLAAGMNRLVGNTADVLRVISTAATEVGTATAAISQGNVDLSQRTAQQSSSLEETAVSMEKMTAAVKNNADNAAEASQLALATRDQAEKGGGVVQSAVGAMTEINASSKKISDIIGVIDDIAFQTNLLALNAAVEAAHAGDQGRGFAIVASEVRILAARSAAAAKEIKNLIRESVAKVDDGSKLVDASGKALQDIVSSVKKVTDVVAEIAASSQEQAEGIAQVNRAIISMDEMTQQNAALVEEASAAAQAMTEQSANLTHMLGRFRVGDSLQTANAPPAALPAVSPERRSPTRTWARSTAKPLPKSASAPEGKKAAAGSSTDWTEF